MTVIALYPQISLWLDRGSQWQGSYVMTQGDEILYSAYVNALIDGRPRRNDPFSGRDAVPGQPAYESVSSIQFAAAYAIALPARAFGLSAATAFIALIVIAAIVSTLAIFWLLATITGDSKSAAAGALFTLCFGALAGSECCWHENAFTAMVPFLRRYPPATAFPLFFVFCVFVWRAVTHDSSRTSLIRSLMAGAVFAAMVLTYFYTWTAAMAWFACLVLLWILFRRDELGRIALTTIGVGVTALAGIVTFLVMFRNRHSTDEPAQLLLSTRAPELVNQPEVIGFVVLGVLAHAAWRKRVDVRSPAVLFTMAFTLMPFVVFNQQVVTGFALQPMHYKTFIANYVALLSVVLVCLILWRSRDPRRRVPASLLIGVAVVAFGWGLFEVSTATARRAHNAVRRDDFRAVTKRMIAMASEDGSVQAALAGKASFPTVFTATVDETLEVSQSIPTDGPLAVLYSLHSDGFIGVAESKERYYRQLYYSGLTPQMAAARMRNNEFWVVVPLFGSERVIRGFRRDFKPVTVSEMEEERARYAEFYNNFTRQHAADPVLSFVVVPDGPDQPDLTNLDRWYERDSGQRIGPFTAHRVTLRP